MEQQLLVGDGEGEVAVLHRAMDRVDGLNGERGTQGAEQRVIYQNVSICSYYMLVVID